MVKGTAGHGAIVDPLSLPLNSKSINFWRFFASFKPSDILAEPLSNAALYGN